MEIKKFNDMKAYMLKPNRLFTSKKNTIGGGAIQGEDLGSRIGLQDPKPYAVQKISKQGGKPFERVYTKKPGKKTVYDVNEEALKNEWRKTLTKKDPVPWKNFLEKKFPEGAEAIRKRIEAKKNFFPAEEFSVVRDKKRQNRLAEIEKLKEAHQNSDKFLYDAKSISKKLGVYLTRKDNAAELDLIDTFDSREDKIRKAFDKITSGNMKLYKPKRTASRNISKMNPVYQMISDMVSNPELSARYSTDNRIIMKALENHKPYLEIKDDFDYFAQNEASNFAGKNFQEGFEYAKYKRGGLDIKNSANFSKVYALPEQNILNFAIRNAYVNFKNEGDAAVKLFFLNKDGTKGEPVDFNNLPKDRESRARILDANKIGFEYEGQFFDKKNLRTEGFKSGLFDEVYDMSQKGRIQVPDPNNPNSNISLKQLLENTGDKLTIGHNDAKGGVAGNPFNDLRIESGKFNVSLFQAYDKIKNPQARKAVINKLQGTFGHLKGDKYEQAFIDSKSKLAKDLFERPTSGIEPSYYRAAGQEVLQDLGKDFFSKSIPFQTEIARVAGINLEEYAANKNKFRQYLNNQFCNYKSQGGRIGFANGPSCTPDTVAEGMKKSIEQGDSAKVMKALKVGKNLLGKVVAPADIAIETAFALPYLLEGDLEGAKQATTLGFFGWGKDLQEQVGDRFGTNSAAFGALEKQRAIDLQVEGIFEMDKALNFGEKAGVFKKDSEGNYLKNPDLTVSQQDSLKLSNNIFKKGAEKSLEAQNLFKQSAPKILGSKNESTALSQLGVFSDELRSGVLNEKIGDPGIVSNLFKSLNVSQPAERSVEDYISTLGGQTKFPLASKMEQSELIKENLDRLRELRIADFPPDIALGIPQYEKEQAYAGIKPYAMEYGPKAAKEFFEAQGIDTEPYLKGMQPLLYKANGGRINLANGGRLTFAEGPEDPSKRKFLKNVGIGGGIAGGLMTGLINLMDLFKGGKKGVVATKAAESEIEKVYLDLINVVKNKGILKRLDSDLETKVGEVYEYKGVKVLEDGENIELRFETDKGAPAVVEYRKPGYEVDPETGTSQQVPGEFIYEAQETARYGPGGDVDLDFVEEVIDPIDGVTEIADEVFETYVYKSPSNRVKKTNDK
jgi:hypothetical protein